MAELRQFIEYAASLDDVWFVTNQQVGVRDGNGGGRGCAGGWLGSCNGTAAAATPAFFKSQSNGRRAGPPMSRAPACLLPDMSCPPPRLQLLAWMENPVPASRVDLQLKCDPPTDISPEAGPVCQTFVG